MLKCAGNRMNPNTKCNHFFLSLSPRNWCTTKDKWIVFKIPKCILSVKICLLGLKIPSSFYNWFCVYELIDFKIRVMNIYGLTLNSSTIFVINAVFPVPGAPDMYREPEMPSERCFLINSFKMFVSASRPTSSLLKFCAKLAFNEW